MDMIAMGDRAGGSSSARDDREVDAWKG